MTTGSAKSPTGYEEREFLAKQSKVGKKAERVFSKAKQRTSFHRLGLTKIPSKMEVASPLLKGFLS